ncbi:vWA domain-containing protein [Aliikangiella sp. IMCC44359]|uniref:vWA domain-containing protein n=1 Tax=Aliikangiella sp. IMCC44359 TaxID=3459125 RepID=UPI00403A8144
MNVMTSAALAALIFPALVSKADEAQINITSKSEYSAPKIIIRSKYNFEKPISLKLKTDLSLLPSEALIKVISKYNMVDEKGIKITSGFDVDVKNNLVIGFSGGKTEIIKTSKLPDGFKVVSSFKDSAGNFIAPPKNSLAAYTSTGEKLCFSYDVRQEPKMAFTLLLDKSGSMENVIGEVKSEAKRFLKLLPKSSLCAVASFNSSYHYAHKNYQSCHGNNFGIDAMTSSGGTDIYKPLKSAYSNLSGAFFKDYQKAVIIITDGYTVKDEQRKQELLSLKKDTLTFVHFIGGNEKDALEGITDHFTAPNGNVKDVLAQYFNVISNGYKAQKVLHVQQCSKASS